MRAGRAAALVLALLLVAGCAQAGSTRYCDEGQPLNAAQKDRLLRFAGIVKAELGRSGARLALVSRSGLDLDFFGVRYSHGGVSLLAGADTPWAVRQLYFSCDERRPRIYDQGIAAFVLGTHQPDIGYVSAVLLPPEAEAAVQAVAADKQRALQLLGPVYSANAYAFATLYQNCNQWTAELLAAAWGPDLGTLDSETARGRAQAWLRASGYYPMAMELGWRPLMWASAAIPWLHRDDHPAADLDANRFRVSMPAAIEAYARARAPGARRLEFCHDAKQVVIRRGWELLPEGCRPGPGDEVIALD
ncbi:conserved exported hypothetical protein [Rubrivivax sp. A210]|uniref:DUF2145 domain-containing protein n=1 Tax=Rubrivivax sp. A210 TaxID=2772301 RepID=UPI0019187D62|nr:DUF2145 domain-containing protein [Rubrivivax sp. A210]CAD5372491.1 conserved exported hypothetical protein [Rubrivivax sp. A210]